MLVVLATVCAAPARVHALSGGVPDDGSHAFVVKLRVGDNVRACSGALISPWLVLTTATCFSGAAGSLQAGAPPVATTAIIGRSDLNAATGYEVAVVAVTPHPTRNLALAELQFPVQQVAAISLTRTPPSPGEVLRVAGYGRTSTTWIPSRAQSADFVVQQVDTDVLALDSTGTPSASTCKGDAGGPAFRELDGTPELVAINHVSSQNGCLGESATQSGITETRVDDLSDWIDRLPARGRRHGAFQWTTNGKCVASPRNMGAGDSVELWGCQGSPDVASKAQHWQWRNDSPLIVHGTNSGDNDVYLDFPLGQSSGTPLQIWPASGLASQRWSFIETELVSGGVCLDIPAANTVAEAKLQFYPCNRTPAQLWTLPGDGTIRPTSHLELCVDNPNDLQRDGQQLQLWPCNGSPAQQWLTTAHGVVNPRGCLDRNPAATAGQVPEAQLWSCSPARPSQYVWLRGSLQNEQGFSMDVREGNPNDGTTIHGWQHIWNLNQQFLYWP